MGVLRANTRVVKASRDRMGLFALPLLILKEVRHAAVQDTWCTGHECGRVMTSLNTRCATSLGADELDVLIVDKGVKDTNRIGTSADTGDDIVWQTTSMLEHVGAGFFAKHRLEVTNHARKRV